MNFTYGISTDRVLDISELLNTRFLVVCRKFGLQH